MSGDSSDYQNQRLQEWRNRTDIPLLIIGIGSLPFLLLEIVSDRLPSSDDILLLVINFVVFAAFLADYVVELSKASNKRGYLKREWTSLVIVLAQALAVLPALTALGALRLVRIVRAFSLIARIAAIGGSTAASGRVLLRKRAASFAMGVAGLTWLSSAVAFTLVEDVGDGRRIHSFFDALWWSTTTVTTVGYGDIFPVTAAGRVIAAFTMLVGVSTFAVVTAKVAQFLIRSEE